MARLYATADRTGVIEFERIADVDGGAITFASGPARQLRELVEVNARHSYDGVTLLVPGIPEAPTDEEALKALRRFRELIELRLAGQSGWPS